MIKYCIKGNGTAEYGKKIIKFFESLGGRNRFNFTCMKEEMYYFINSDNHISCLYGLRKDHTEVELLENGMAKGVWYKDYNNDYCKIKGLDRDSFITTYAILFELESGKFDCISENYKYDDDDLSDLTPLTNLTEIQPYLPDGHEDKMETVIVGEKGNEIEYNTEELKQLSKHEPMVVWHNDVCTIHNVKTISEVIEILNNLNKKKCK